MKLIRRQRRRKWKKKHNPHYFHSRQHQRHCNCRKTTQPLLPHELHLGLNPWKERVIDVSLVLSLFYSSELSFMFSVHRPHIKRANEYWRKGGNAQQEGEAPDKSAEWHKLTLNCSLEIFLCAHLWSSCCRINTEGTCECVLTATCAHSQTRTDALESIGMFRLLCVFNCVSQCFVWLCERLNERKNLCPTDGRQLRRVLLLFDVCVISPLMMWRRHDIPPCSYRSPLYGTVGGLFIEAATHVIDRHPVLWLAVIHQGELVPERLAHPV